MKHLARSLFCIFLFALLGAGHIAESQQEGSCPPPVCLPTAPPTGTRLAGNAWIFNLATCTWQQTPTPPPPPPPPPPCTPGNTQPPYPAPSNGNWVWDSYTCAWVLTTSTAPCPQPTYAPGFIVPWESWAWSSVQCQWAPVPPASAPGSSPPSCTGPSSNPPNAPPVGATWSWDNADCSWILVPDPGTIPPPPCTPQSEPQEAPYPGEEWEWITQYCQYVMVPTYGGNPNSGSPIVIDTDGSGFHLTSAAAGVKFDFYGTGTPIQISWTAAGSTNGWLALDRNNNGVIDNAGELFGNMTQQPTIPADHQNGFLALAVFDTAAAGGDGNGRIDRGDAVWPNLVVWIDANHDGISQPNELHHLDDIKIHSIDLRYKESRYTDQYGNTFRYKGRLNPVSPDTVDRLIYDVFLQTGP